jgi:hypothetical protein
MKGILLAGAALALLASVYVMRIVVHGYTHHGNLDVFHLFVAIVSTSAGLFFLRRAFRRRVA